METSCRETGRLIFLEFSEAINMYSSNLNGVLSALLHTGGYGGTGNINTARCNLPLSMQYILELLCVTLFKMGVILPPLSSYVALKMC